MIRQMIKGRAKDQSGERLMQQFLRLPILLGVLLLVTGSFGIYAPRNSRNDLTRLNATALGPTLAFNCIVDNLNELSLNALRLNQVGTNAETRERLIKKLK